MCITAVSALALPFVIRAEVVQGVATATEVSTIGMVYSLIAGLIIYRQFDWRRLFPMLVETAFRSGATLLIIGTATGLAWGLTQSGFSKFLAEFMVGLPGRTALFLMVTIAVQAFVRHAHSLGQVHYPMTTLGHLFDRLSFKFCRVADCLQ